MRKYGIFGILFLSLCLFGAVHTAYAAEEEESLQITQEELLDEFDFSDLDDSLKKMFPREKMTFRDVVETLVSGDLKKAGERCLQIFPAPSENVRLQRLRFIFFICCLSHFV